MALWASFKQKSRAKKSLYVFLTSLLGVLLFLIIHRLLVFSYIYLYNVNPQQVSGRLTYYELLAIDFVTLMLALLGGAWYGIWLGLNWYETIYEEKKHLGFVDYFIKKYWPQRIAPSNLKQKVELVAEELKDEIFELENLAKTIKPVLKPSSNLKRRSVKERPALKR